MQRLHYQENAWNEHSLFAFFVKIPKAKRLPYISLNGDLAKLEIKQNTVPFSLIFKANP